MMWGRDARVRLRTKGFALACFCGACAGLLSVYVGATPLAAGVAIGILIATVAGSIGGLFGMFLRWGMGRLRHTAPSGSWSYESDPVTILSAYGAFLGTVSAMLAGDWAQARFWTGAGAFLGGAMAMALPAMADVLLVLLLFEEPGGKGAVRYVMKRAASGRMPIPHWPGADNLDD